MQSTPEVPLNLDEMSLDDLFKEAKRSFKAAEAARRERRTTKRQTPEQSAQLALYADPANWRRTRGVVLIDAKTQVCLGNFSEYVHRSVAGCRKLIREELPVSCAAVEYVEGFHGWTAGEAPQRAVSVPRRVTATLSLERLGVRSVACEVLVSVCYGDISRVELVTDQTLVQLDAPELLILPAGTDILEMLSRTSLTAIHQELSA